MTQITMDIPERTRGAAPRKAPGPAQQRTKAHARRVGSAPALLDRIMQRPFRSFLQVAMLASGTCIALNALVFQSSRHPSPWGTAGIERMQEAAPLPPTRPNTLSASAPQPTSPVNGASAKAAAPVPVPAAKEVVREPSRDAGRAAQQRPDYMLSGMPSAPVPPGAVKAVAQAGRDPIGDLIRGAEPVRSAGSVQKPPVKSRPE